MGHFDCADKFEMLRWLLGTEVRIQPGTPVVPPPAGVLHLGCCLIHQDPSLLGKYMHKCLNANYLFDWRVLTSSLIVQVWSDCAGNAIESRMTHELRALNIFHDLRCFCLGRSFDLSDIG